MSDVLVIRLEEAHGELAQTRDTLALVRAALGRVDGTDPVSAALLEAEAALGPAGGVEGSAAGAAPPPADAEARFVSAAGRLTSRLLLAVQRLYRAQEELDAALLPGDPQQGLLGVRIDESLQRAVAGLDARRVVSSLAAVCRPLVGADISDEQAARMITLLSQLVPLLNQYHHLCTFVLVHQMAAYRSATKLLTVLLKLFTIMAQKGFCTPEDMQDEPDDSEAGTEFKDIQDGGLGEGEGSKDVSDKLESEDQLEGAYKPGEQPEDANEDVKEEEQGVEMSEDFGGKMQDVEKKEGDDDSDESDHEGDEEPDKQMGEVDGEDQERLDEKALRASNRLLALRAGDWLLVDNVNFCPASPGGVLELSERGVIDGLVPTVRPHPHFRLLLAMDPRHGEISRAMRNRGVEIYMLGPEEGGGLRTSGHLRRSLTAQRRDQRPSVAPPDCSAQGLAAICGAL
ncbi:midasin-like [Pollicipes pollicipes]|uniref:midasin-like n=1 Tax=Pollicipes pollicipes TaxID=41117 RepID=UPI001884C7DD|nr:midasin-like [Pollicipes pollicipes]